MVRRLSTSCNLLMTEADTDEEPGCGLKDGYRGSSVPVFLPIVTTLEIGFFFYFLSNSNDPTASSSKGPRGHLAAGSCFIYRPDRRHEIWRFALYMLVHVGWWHLLFNVTVQMLLGVPLELTHGALRIGTVYMSGILAGSLATSVFDSDAFLVGASGAVYALIAAHLANILLNFSEMELGLLKLTAVCTIAVADVGFTLWDRTSSTSRNDAAAAAAPPVSYVSHLMGAVSGLGTGLVVLKRSKQKPRSRLLWWLALTVELAFFSSAVIWNVISTL